MTKFLTWDAATKVLSQVEETVQIPAGTIMATIAATADTGYELLDGTTVVNAQTLMPALWAKIPTSWKSGADMVKPDWREKTLGGFKSGSATHGTLGGATGANTKTIASGNLPVHTHSDGTLAASTPSINSTGGPSTASTGTPSSTNTSTPSTNTSGAPSTASTGTVSADHTHGFTTGGQSQSHLHAAANGTGEILARDGAYSTGYNGPHISVVGGGVAITWAGTTAAADRDHSHSGTTGGISANHTHSMQSHTHDLGNHTHTLSSHTHNLSAHTHDLQNHTHDVTGATGDGGFANTALDVINAAGVVNWQIKAH